MERASEDGAFQTYLRTFQFNRLGDAGLYIQQTPRRSDAVRERSTVSTRQDGARRSLLASDGGGAFVPTSSSQPPHPGERSLLIPGF